MVGDGLGENRTIINMKVNVSIHDFAPLLKGHEFLFKRLKETGIDGVELAVGIKSRWSAPYYKSLSRKYNLPIVSLHQPVWAWLDLYFDEGFFAIAKELDVQYVTCHPLPKISFQSKRMREYLKRLSQIQSKTGIQVLIENMPEKYNHKLLSYLFPQDTTTRDIMSLSNTISEFGLNMTLDIDHLQSSTPHKEPFFTKIYPKIKNIHLSSFDGKKRHMPLYIGNFHAAEFIQYLNKVNYKGLLTFEINSTGLTTLFDYDFNAIKKSVEVVKV
jgi:sugar phosphate isomerase/epimerase